MHSKLLLHYARRLCTKQGALPPPDLAQLATSEAMLLVGGWLAGWLVGWVGLLCDCPALLACLPVPHNSAFPRLFPGLTAFAAPASWVACRSSWMATCLSSPPTPPSLPSCKTLAWLAAPRLARQPGELAGWYGYAGVRVCKCVGV